MHYYIEVVKKYAEFDGRAGRAEYWYFILINLIISIILEIISPLIGDDSYAILGLYSLIMAVPGLAVGARRLHDIGKSGWMQVLSIIPIIGFIWLIVLLATEGDSGGNEYGPSPREVSGL